MRAVDVNLSQQALAHRADVVEAMKDTEGWILVQADLERQIAAVQASILTGQLAHETYLSQCGVLRGLQTALNLPDTLSVRSPDQTEEQR